MMNTFWNQMGCARGGFGDGGWSGFGFGWILTVLFWAFIIWAIIALVRWLMGDGHGKMHGKEMWRETRKETTPLDIIKERYAKGEINKEEFEQKKKDLTS